MGILRWLGIGLAGVLAFVTAVAIGARFIDGGIAVFPGGPLESGELVAGPEAGGPGSDWEFARDIPEMAFALEATGESRTVWLLVHEGRLFVVSGYMKTPIGRLWKKWPAEAERDGRSVVRIDGKRYERNAVRIHDDPEIFAALSAEALRKYGVLITPEGVADGEAWVFELLPR